MSLLSSVVADNLNGRRSVSVVGHEQLFLIPVLVGRAQFTSAYVRLVG